MLPDKNLSKAEFRKQWEAICKELEQFTGLRVIKYSPGVTLQGSDNQIANIPAWFTEHLLKMSRG